MKRMLILGAIVTCTARRRCADQRVIHILDGAGNVMASTVEGNDIRKLYQGWRSSGTSR